MLLKTCTDCITEFLAPTPQAKLCQSCRTGRQRKVVRPNRHFNSTEFIAVDGEGIGDDYVLLGVGQEQIEWPGGLTDATDAFEFLYAQFLLHPRAYFVGFFLTYDWNMWLKCLPRNRAAALLEPDKVASRKRKVNPRSKPFPVEYRGWEFDLLWKKRFRLKPARASQWMSICDTGSFFQSSLLKALKSRAPDSAITPAMFDKIAAGKEKRSSAALDDEMREYNRLENRALEILLQELDGAFKHIGTPLGKTQFHGPGQASQKWLQQQSGYDQVLEKVNNMSAEIYGPIQASYYGGMFEIQAHGHVPYPVWEYDINSAYPTIIAGLPCLCGEWRRGTGVKPEGAKLTLWHGEFVGKGTRLGPLPYRAKNGSVLRPYQLSGWYWDFEIAASWQADLLSYQKLDEWVCYMGCEHPPPLAAIAALYEERITVGKESSLGKVYKLVYNSAYGKTAQSVGNPKVSCAVYAALITAGCRAQIIRAVASHPDGVRALVMVATDAVFFVREHPGLTISHKLGEWEASRHEEMTIFKPGMYWDERARRAINAGEAPVFKTRGVRAKDFAESIGDIDADFLEWDWDRDADPQSVPVWPVVKIPVSFAQISIKTALARTHGKSGSEQEDAYRAVAGKVIIAHDPPEPDDIALKHSSSPVGKRAAETLTRDSDGLWRTEEYFQHEDGMETTPYDKSFGWDDDQEDPSIYTNEDGMDLAAALMEALK